MNEDKKEANGQKLKYDDRTEWTTISFMSFVLSSMALYQLGARLQNLERYFNSPFSNVFFS
jgi:hypothetical protein